MSSPSPFTVTVRPRYGEVDSMGVVYHAHYLVYFEIGRTEFMRARGSAYAALEERGFRLAVVDAAVRYRQPARYDEELTVAVWLTSVRRASITFEYELLGPDGTHLASGSTRLGCIDGSHRPTGLPADVQADLAAGVSQGPGPQPRGATGSPGRPARPQPSEAP